MDITEPPSPDLVKERLSKFNEAAMNQIHTEDDLFWVLGIGRFGQSEFECDVLPKLLRRIYTPERKP